jgi:predicted DNA-binding protein (UPF0251 family)
MPFPQGVLVCKIVKTRLDKDNWYLHFEYVEVKPEKEALPKKPKTSKVTDKKDDAKPADKAQKKGKKQLTDEQKAEIARLYEQKIMKSSEIAKKYQINVKTVQRIVNEARDARA